MARISKKEIQKSIVPVMVLLFLFSIMVLFFKYRTLPLGILLLATAATSVLFLLNRNLFQGRDITFYKGEQERQQLLYAGRNGPAEYVRQEQDVIGNLVSEEFLTYAKLNLSTGYIYNAQPEMACEVLNELDGKMLSIPLRAMHQMNLADAYIQMGDRAHVEESFRMAKELVEHADRIRLTGMMQMLSLRYDVFEGRYEQVLEKLEEIPEDFTDEVGECYLDVLRAVCLKGTGKGLEAKEIVKMLPEDTLLPNMEHLLEKYDLLESLSQSYKTV